ncbi:MAG: TonB-dependent receptor, partial [Ignavibacteria bacterium]
MKKVIYLFFVFPYLLFAGTTGKITGKVVDAKTGEPIPSVNIIIEGTNFGTATHIDGFYIINNVPPGVYTLVISAIGYEKKIIRNVKVSADFTTKLNIELSEEVVELQEIVVEAQSPLIREDLTSTQATIDASQIEALPVESIHQILSLQAGITQGVGGELHIRGGRTNEIAYTVNGVAIVNPFDNSPMVEIATNAVQEISVISGTFNAEYGNALSGVVNTITKEGSSEYRGHISFYTGDYLSTRKNIFFNVDDVNPMSNNVTELTFSGPIPFAKNKLNFFLSARNEDNKGWLFGVREHNPWDSVYINPANPNDIKIAKSGDDAIVPMNPSRKFSGTLKITIKPSSTIKVNYDLLYSNNYYKFYTHDFKYNPD